MHFGGSVSAEDVRRILTPPILKSYQVVYISFAVGVLAFFFVVFYFFLQSFGEEVTGISEDSLSYVQMLTLLHVILSLLVYPVAFLLHAKMLDRAFSRETRSTTAEAVVNGFRTAGIVRLAMVEWTAFFGLVVIFLAVQNGAIRVEPLYWLNLFSSFVLFGFVAVTFPSRDRLENLCSERLT